MWGRDVEFRRIGGGGGIWKGWFVVGREIGVERGSERSGGRMCI